MTAHKELDLENGWIVKFNPKQKMGGVVYSQLTGFIDEQEAEWIVQLINNNSFDYTIDYTKIEPDV